MLLARLLCEDEEDEEDGEDGGAGGRSAAAHGKAYHYEARRLGYEAPLLLTYEDAVCGRRRGMANVMAPAMAPALVSREARTAAI